MTAPLTAAQVRQLLSRDSLEVAPLLLGAQLTHGGVTVRLTEVEAYAGERDPGSHAYRGLTPRTAVMFGPAGHLYVYFSYGMHWCANIVCGPDGVASAVLLRAGEVVAGQDVAAGRRQGIRPRDWARGPARLTTTLGLSGNDNGMDVLGEPPLLALSGPVPPGPVRVAGPAPSIRTGPRVGVSGPGGDGAAYPWRFWLDGEPSVSAYRPGRPSRRG